MDTLFDARQLCSDGCGRELTGVKWEVMKLVPARPLITVMEELVSGREATWEHRIVCSSCAHKYQRKRQLP